MYLKNEPYVLVLGASVVDIFGFSRSKYTPYNSTPGNVKMSFGGVCRNIAENMARIGVNTKFISVLGNDEMGLSILQHSNEIGYDMKDSLILRDGSTPTYMAILDEHGEMVSAIVDMKSINEMDINFIKSKSDIIIGSKYTVLDSDNPKNLEYILKTYKGCTNFILDPISAVKAESVKHLVGHFHTVKPNIYEAEALCGFPIHSSEDLKMAGEYLLNKGVKNVFISLDEEGVYYVNEKESGKIKASNVLVKNVTGAGDAFVAGLTYGYINELCIEETVKTAMAMSIITISHEETIHPEMCKDFMEEVIKSTDWTELKYI